MTKENELEVFCKDNTGEITSQVLPVPGDSLVVEVGGLIASFVESPTDPRCAILKTTRADEREVAAFVELAQQPAALSGVTRSVPMNFDAAVQTIERLQHLLAECVPYVRAGGQKQPRDTAEIEFCRHRAANALLERINAEVKPPDKE